MCDSNNYGMDGSLKVMESPTLYEASLYPIIILQQYEIRTLENGDFRHGKICVQFKKNRNETINPVLRVSVCLTFGIHDTPVLKPGSTTPSFQTGLTLLSQSCWEAVIEL